MQFKVGDKVRFKGRDNLVDIRAIDDKGYIWPTGYDVGFPESSFTNRKFKSIHRVPFRCAILPLTMEKIKKSAKSTQISEGKLIDQWASATYPPSDEEMAK